MNRLKIVWVEYIAIIWFSAAVVACSILEWEQLKGGARLPATARDMFSAALSFSGITAGFAGTAKAILASSDHARWAKFLRDNDRRNPFIRNMTSTIYLSLFVAGGALVGLHSSDWAGRWARGFWIIWRAAGVAPLASVWRVSSVLADALYEPPPPPPQPAPPSPQAPAPTPTPTPMPAPAPTPTPTPPPTPTPAPAPTPTPTPPPTPTPKRRPRKKTA